MSFLLVLWLYVGLAYGIEWDLNMCYNNQDLWPQECRKNLQAPIPLNNATAVRNTSLSIRFSEGYEKPTALSVANIGITWEIKPINNSELYIVVDWTDSYYLGAIYPHWPSEHTINGKRFDLELQLVHYKMGLNSWESASRIPGGTYVVTIVFNISDVDNPAFEPILQVHNQVFRTLHTPVKVRGNLGAFLQLEDRSYYVYEGSVPIPDCPENLIWQVYAEPSFISDNQLRLLSYIFSPKGNEVVRSNRDLNDVNDRIVYYSKDERC